MLALYTFLTWAPLFVKNKFGIPFEEAGNIIEISKMCTSYMNLPVGEGITLYDKIVSKMKLLYSCSSYLQVDTVIENAEFEIKSTVANISVRESNPPL